MSQAQNLANSITELFSGEHASWFISFNDSVSGLSAEQAARSPGENFNSIWKIVNHVRFWQEVTTHIMRDMDADFEALGDKNGWPPAGDPSDEAGWKAACERALRTNQGLAAVVAAMSDAQLDERYERWDETKAQIAIGSAAHNGYHINEIISMRHMQGWWLERT
ncbi:MAG: DinB family protein [Burkholderiales bacterium]|nr:DinB family protein [Anaerolineae bacterium]